VSACRNVFVTGARGRGKARRPRQNGLEVVWIDERGIDDDDDDDDDDDGIEL